jgi:hypothetical protein
MLDIRICPNCHTRVVPTNDGACPACRRDIFWGSPGKTRASTHSVASSLPLIVIVCVDARSAGEVDTEVYCYNTTDRSWHIDVRSDSFTTIDEEVGTVVEHGSPPVSCLVKVDEAVKVADVQGWEWDGSVGIDVAFSVPGSSAKCHKSYFLKFPSGQTIDVPGVGPGKVVDPWRL